MDSIVGVTIVGRSSAWIKPALHFGRMEDELMVPMGRIELPTSPLPRECSATELHGHDPEPLQNDYLKGGATKSPVRRPG